MCLCELPLLILCPVLHLIKKQWRLKYSWISRFNCAGFHDVTKTVHLIYYKYMSILYIYIYTIYYIYMIYINPNHSGRSNHVQVLAWQWESDFDGCSNKSSSGVWQTPNPFSGSEKERLISDIPFSFHLWIYFSEHPSHRGCWLNSILFQAAIESSEFAHSALLQRNACEHFPLCWMTKEFGPFVT